jgi:hypothetical protein
MSSRVKASRFACGALACALATAAVLAAPADDKKDAKDKAAPKVEKSESELALESFTSAYELAAYGRRTKTAEALATAALMIAKTPFADVELPKEKQEGVEVSAYDPKAEANKLLAEAKKIDPKDRAVAEIAEKVADLLKEKSRSPVGGVKTFNISLSGGKTWTYTATYPVTNQPQTIGVAQFNYPGNIQLRLADPSKPGISNMNYSTNYSNPRFGLVSGWSFIPPPGGKVVVTIFSNASYDGGFVTLN